MNKCFIIFPVRFALHHQSDKYSGRLTGRGLCYTSIFDPFASHEDFSSRNQFEATNARNYQEQRPSPRLISRPGLFGQVVAFHDAVEKGEVEVRPFIAGQFNTVSEGPDPENNVPAELDE